jgi:hypothetical protein
MDNPPVPTGSISQKSEGHLGISKIMDNMLNWLFGFVNLTNQEQEDAGIYLGGPLSNNKENE